MKQETIGSKGTVPGFRPLIGKERWHRDDFTAEMLGGGWRPLLLGEQLNSGDGDQWIWSGEWVCHADYMTERGASINWKSTRTRRPLTPPAVETFEAHGHIWYKHTPGDDAPIEPDATVDVLWSKQMSHPCHFTGTYVAKYQNWSETADGESVIGYRFPDYPAVHTTLQQEQQTVRPSIETIPTQFSTEQRLTSLYNDWCFLPPETVAECIADVASVLYPTDAERCEAAFQRWFKEWGYPGVAKGATDIVWHAAWKAAKESK